MPLFQWNHRLNSPKYWSFEIDFGRMHLKIHNVQESVCPKLSLQKALIVW